MNTLSNNLLAAPTHKRNTTLWLVDDNAEFRRLITQHFEQTESIQCARDFGSAEAALNALESEPAPDVILSDVHMGGMSGIEAVSLIRRLAPRTHVLLFSSFYDLTAARAACEAGASGFLAKSHGFERILEAIHVLVSAPRDRRSARVSPDRFIGMLVVSRQISEVPLRPSVWSKGLWQRILKTILALGKFSTLSVRSESRT